RQQGIDWNRNDPGTQRTPECDGKVDCIQQQQGKPLFPGDAGVAHCICEPVGCLGQAPIGHRPPRIGERKPIGVAVAQMAVDKPVGGVTVGPLVHGPPSPLVFFESRSTVAAPNQQYNACTRPAKGPSQTLTVVVVPWSPRLLPALAELFTLMG